MIKQDYSRNIVRELDRSREESVVARIGLYMLAVLVAALFYFGG